MLPTDVQELICRFAIVNEYKQQPDGSTVRAFTHPLGMSCKQYKQAMHMAVCVQAALLQCHSWLIVAASAMHMQATAAAVPSMTPLPGRPEAAAALMHSANGLVAQLGHVIRMAANGRLTHGVQAARVLLQDAQRGIDATSDQRAAWLFGYEYRPSRSTEPHTRSEFDITHTELLLVAVRQRLESMQTTQPVHDKAQTVVQNRVATQLAQFEFSVRPTAASMLPWVAWFDSMQQLRVALLDGDCTSTWSNATLARRVQLYVRLMQICIRRKRDRVLNEGPVSLQIRVR